jgi:hypothetical protein
MLTSAHDEALFDFYFATQLALVDAATGSHTNIGRPAIVGNMDPSPNGEYILVSRIKRPYSWLIGASAFPNDVVRCGTGVATWSRRWRRFRLPMSRPSRRDHRPASDLPGASRSRRHSSGLRRSIAVTRK